MWQNYKPTVNKIWLYLIAGLMWSGVGLMLCSLAVRWLLEIHSGWSILMGFTGFLFSLIAYRFGFSRLAQKNIQRLHALLERVWIFAFMSLKSYLLVIFMMALGMALRRSFIPHSYLAVIYSTIGGGLFFSSLSYYQTIFVMIGQKSG